jgi:hypothetical protein
MPRCPIGEGEKALLYPVTWDEGTFNLQPNGTAPGGDGQQIVKAKSWIEVKAMTREWETILEVIPSGKAVFRIADLPARQHRANYRPKCRLGEF